MISKIILTISLLLCCGSRMSAQNINKAKAIRIAKADTATKIKRIKSVRFITDSLTNRAFWLVEEKVNTSKKQMEFQGAGMHFIYANQLKIDAETGTIISREEIEVHSVHQAPKF